MNVLSFMGVCKGPGSVQRHNAVTRTTGDPGGDGAVEEHYFEGGDKDPSSSTSNDAM